GIPNSRFNAITVPRYSAKSVAADAASAASQYGMMNIFFFSFPRIISGNDCPVAIPILPDKY
ncbi:MAG: hypothetical protein WA220_13515, partial [Candidatus Nitrosopolaris sp.]